MTASIPPAAVRRLAFLRALRRRCPQCGEGDVFLRYARVAPACDACGLVFRREQGAQTGSMYLTAAVTQVFAIALVGLVYGFTDWSVALSIGVVVPIVLAFCYLFLPFSQSLWVAVEYVTDVANGEEWASPRS